MARAGPQRHREKIIVGTMDFTNEKTDGILHSDAIFKLRCSGSDYCKLGLPIIRCLPDMAFFFAGFRFVSLEIFNLPKMSGFFLAFVDGHTQFFCSRHVVIVPSSRTPRFDFRTYFHSVPVDPNACSQCPVRVVSFELCAFVYALFRESFYRVTAVMKRKRKLMDELKIECSCFRSGHESGKPND